ncbi:hypothetical protein CD113_00050 [Staphylococcus simiae]|uniref:Uncharacterized protein n=1 Tax=Staphylococcus simiae CCM 7213 = CCUG 51256 TaxID=911238 RepID=G5JK41_9STAP|nr:hypothetical protein SS7213T_09262 [Staphylococcus simiae CCM 7213 = CCUG 51256]PNZ14944.1 hypothetical protein CD113_00050 [Staphylococcus simiae]
MTDFEKKSTIPYHLSHHNYRKRGIAPILNSIIKILDYKGKYIIFEDDVEEVYMDLVRTLIYKSYADLCNFPVNWYIIGIKYLFEEVWKE